MSKPEDIPGPVLIEGMRVAANVFNAYHNDDDGLGLEAPGVIVARAIMAERERCATVADVRWREFDAKLASGNVPEHLHERAVGRAFEAQHLAAAIRNGAQ